MDKYLVKLFTCFSHDTIPTHLVDGATPEMEKKKTEFMCR